MNNVKSVADLYNSVKILAKANKPFCALKDRTLSYRDLQLRVMHISGFYQSRELKRGSKIVICTNNDDAIISFSLAALFNGLTTILLSGDQKSQRVSSIVKRVKADLVVVDEAFSIELISDMDQSHYVIPASIRSEKNALLSKFKREKKDWFSKVQEFSAYEPTLDIDSKDIAYINFSSGTTDQPKGIQLSVRNVMTHMESLRRRFGYDEKSRILNNMILAHADGYMQGPLLALYSEATVYRTTGMEIQEIENYLDSIYRDRITHMITVPTIFSFIDRLARHDDYFISEDIKHVISVAGMMNVDLWRRVEKRFDIRICNIYGLTETVAGGVYCGPDEESFEIGTVGMPYDMELRILDEDGKDAEEGIVGEICLKGGNVFSGYYDEVNKTKEAFKDDWFKTGDLGFINESNRLVISGRKKELIVSGGFNIHPEEVNEVLLRHDSIEDVCTLGVSHEEWQEIVVSVIVVKAGETLSSDEVVHFCRKWLEEKKMPREILFIDSLPKGDARKNNLPAVKEWVESKRLKQNKAVNAASIYDVASRVFKVDKAHLSSNTTSDDIQGWDSLGHLTFMTELEEVLGVSFSARDIMSVESISAIEKLIEQKIRNDE